MYIQYIKFVMVNGLISFLGQRNETSLNECVANMNKTVKSGDAVKHPMIRVRQLAHFARDLGLLNLDGDELSLTPVGQKYFNAFAGDIWHPFD